MRIFAWFNAMTAVIAGCMVLVGSARQIEPSSVVANELVTLMKVRNLDAFAAADPEVPGRFVAALLVPDVQLLVVGAKSTSPDYVRAQIADKNYREVYSTLHAAAVPETKLFVQDMGSDGLTGDEGSVDIMYERGTVQTVFDGNWSGQKMSKSKYQEKLQKADAEYSRMLALLRKNLSSPPDAGSAVAPQPPQLQR